jgi:DNA-directed RNA polymerase specialized sigma24 family protein
LRFFLANYCGSGARSYLDEWDINGAFFHAFLHATKNYDPSRNVPFLTYFRKIFENEIIAVYREKQRSIPYGVISLDEEMYSGDNGNDTFTLSEMVPSQSTMDDPVAFMRYMDVLQITNHLPKKVPEEALAIVRLKAKGYSLRAAAKELGIAYSYARKALILYRDYAMRTLTSIFNFDEDKLRQKQERFDSYIVEEDDDEDNND